MRKVRATIEYDGTAYQGFQVQVNRPTIQGALEKALQSVTGESIRITGAGRTDAGVHARGQVAHLTTAWPHSLETLERAWNAMLPPDIAVRDLEQVPEDFHARFSASSREYRYTIYMGAVRSPLLARTSHHQVEPLDVGAMSEAALALEGEHDFAAFGRAPWADDTMRVVHRARFQRQIEPLTGGELLFFDIEANAFLRRMVRLIVGTLLLVGKGVLSPEAFRNILLAGNLNHPVAAVVPAGLCLMRVNYNQR